MPTLPPGVAISGPAVSGLTLLPPTDAVPMPMPIAIGEPAPGGRLRILTGTEGDDRLVLSGGFASGGAGNDTFVLTSTHGDVDGPEHLGTILDFQAGDSLDLTQLGAKAAELGRELDVSGGQRVSIDIDGDGQEDAFVVLHENGAPAADDTGVVTLPGGEGEFHILPYPMPGDDGVVTILPYPMPGDDGVMTILPFPMPGDGEVTILPVAGVALEAGEGFADVDVTAVSLHAFQSMSLDWIA